LGRQDGGQRKDRRDYEAKHTFIVLGGSVTFVSWKFDREAPVR